MAPRGSDVMTFERDEVEAAFRNYWQRGAVGEEWDAWCDECFTEDVTYIERVLRLGDDARTRLGVCHVADDDV